MKLYETTNNKKTKEAIKSFIDDWRDVDGIFGMQLQKRNKNKQVIFYIFNQPAIDSAIKKNAKYWPFVIFRVDVIDANLDPHLYVRSDDNIFPDENHSQETTDIYEAVEWYNEKVAKKHHIKIVRED